MPDEPALILEKVSTSRLDGEGGRKEILREVSLRIPTRCFSVIVGPSGGGKSSLLRLLNRLDDPGGGRILLRGDDIAALDPLDLRRRVGMVPQKPFMFDGSVLANLQRPFVIAREEPPGGDSPEVSRILQVCRLDPALLSQPARTLSLGQQQRVSLARTLLTRPEVLLLDEPTSALDRPTAISLVQTLRDACRRLDLTVVMVTHDLALAEVVADRVAFLADGRIVEEGEATEVLNSPRSRELQAFLSTPSSKE